MASDTTTSIVGVDCAVDFKKVGLAFGSATRELVTVHDAAVGGTLESTVDKILTVIRSSERTLLTLDSPLGWPRKLAEALSYHRAGDPLPDDANQLFRRDTDRFLRSVTKKQSLDVGADRIARTAHAALMLLHELSGRLQAAIPVAWKQDFPGPVAAIEAYPAATLRMYSLPETGYKKRAERARRATILNGLRCRADLQLDTGLVEANADVLDAVLCVLTGADFLRNRCHRPNDPETAHKEGWIWFPKTDVPQTSEGSV